MTGIVNNLKKHIVNFPGKRLKKKYIIFESDDWGGERIPTKKELQNMISDGVDVYKNPFNYLDSLETEEDLSALFDTLSKFRDYKGNHPVITANSISANPEYDKIKQSGFTKYYYETTDISYSNKRGCQKNLSLIKQGMSEGLYHPQFHGREHLNVNQWMQKLQSGNVILRKAFENRIYGIDFHSDTVKRDNLMAAFDFNNYHETIEHRNIIKEGLEIFRDMFGFTPSSFMAPCLIWSPSLEMILKDNGIKYIQGIPFQYAPSDGRGYRKIFHFQGEQNKIRQIYFIRNCFFEPSIYPSLKWLSDCMERLKVIFFWGKPAIIGTHRINFIGSLNEENRKKNLKMFSLLLENILKTYPDAEFTTTDKLGELY